MELVDKIKIKDKDYPIYLTRKNVKRIMIKVNQINEIHLSCPIACKTDVALKYLNAQFSWLEKIIIKQEKIMNTLPVKDFLEDKIALISGQVFDIKIDPNINDASVIKGDILYIKKDLKKSLARIEKDLYFVIEDMFDELNKFFYKRIHQKPFLEIKKMRTRWGSCNYKTGRVVINKALVHTPSRLLNYVLIHEFVHFLHPNHSKSFYFVLEDLLPNYKELEKELKTYSFLLMK